MEIKDLIKDETLASQVSQIVLEKIADTSKEFKAERDQKEAELKASAEAQEKLVEDHKASQVKLEELQKQFDELKATETARQTTETFNARMTKFDEIYKLTDEDRKVIASQVKDLDEEGYVSYEESMKVLLAGKNKEAIAEIKAEEAKKKTDKKESTASVEDVTDEALKNADEDKESIANTSTTETTLKEKFQKAFNIKDGGIKIQN